MHPLFTNATFRWTEAEIEAREALIREIPALLGVAWRALNPRVRLERVETPILTPADGTFEAFRHDWPQQNQWHKILPLCYWQAGESFRNKKNAETMRATKLRLREFWQMEFQLFCLPGTKADFLGDAVQALVARYGGEARDATELPHYSRRTVDWHMGDLEVAGCSLRTDFPGLEVTEIAVGLDRLVAMRGSF